MEHEERNNIMSALNCYMDCSDGLRAVGSTDDAHTTQPKSQTRCLSEFSEKIVNLLVDEAARALQAPDHEGLDYAAYLIQDALKYESLYCHARGVSDQDLFDAAQKLSKRNASQNVNRQST